MKNKYILLIVFIFSLSSCSQDDNEVSESNNDVKQKKIKFVTWAFGPRLEYIYNENNSLQYIITRDIKKEGFPLIDSTKYEYEDNKLSKIVKIINPEGNYTKSEKIFNHIDEDSAQGIYTRKTKTGITTTKLDFSYTFKDSFITSYTEFKLNGDLKFQEILGYDKKGNLSTWSQTSYSSNNVISSEFSHKIIEWNNNGVKIENSPPWSIQTLPGYFISNNYFTKIETQTRTIEHEVTYDEDNHIVKYDIGFGGGITIEYFEE